MDFELTKEGDLNIGPQRINTDNQVLYYTSSSNPTVTTNKSEESIPIHDVKTVYGDREIIQLISVRLQTESPDWIQYPEVGGNLSDYIGVRNTRESARQAEEKIKDAICYDGAFKREEVTVRILPLSRHEWLVDVRVIRGNEVRAPYVLNLEHGLIQEYEVSV